MKILYGVQGTGNGHISRARMMAKHFAARGSQVDYLFSGRPPERYFDMEAFGHYQTRTGLSFATRDGAISYWHTLTESHPIQFLQEIRDLDVSTYDLIITDFEPVTAWAGKLAGKPVIGIGHQYAFHYDGVPHSKRYWLSRIIMRCFAPVTIGLGLHWSDFGGPIVPPIINPAVEGKSGDKIVVYLPFENQQTVTALLMQLPEYQFVQYSPELEDSQCHNVQLSKTNLSGFKRDLANCRAVICNAGFELISECLHLGKAVLAKPVVGQGEQDANALALRQLDFADTIATLNLADIQHWLKHCPSRQPIIYPDVAAELVDWVLNGECHNPDKLARQLWRQTRLLSAGEGLVANS